MLLFFKKEKSVKISEINSVFNRRVIAEFLKSNNQSQVCFSKKWRETLIASPFIKRKKRFKQLCTEDPAGGAVALPVKLWSCSGLQDAASASQAWMLAKSLNLFSKLWKWSQCCLFPFINMENVSVFLSVGKKKNPMSPCDFSNRKYHMNTMGLFPALHAALCLPTSIHLYIPLLSSYFPIPSLPPSRFCDICAPSPLFFHFTILLFFLSCCVGGEKEGRGTGAGAEAEAGACPCIYTLCSPHKQRGTCSRCRRCRRQRWPHRCCSGDHSSGSRAGSWQGDKQQIKSRASINISFLGRCEQAGEGEKELEGKKVAD